MKKLNLLIAVLFLVSFFSFGQTNPQDTNLAQFTFSYPLGTNGYKSYQKTNNVSLNMMIGFNGGVEGCELAGMGNINNGNVNGVQLSGMGNIAKGDINGAQFSGMFNLATGNAKGIQGAGLFNFNKGNFEYIQLAGIFNSNYGTAKGIQGAGIFNSNLGLPEKEEVELVQLSGIFNQNNSVIKGGQASSILNVSMDSLTGFQGGLVNFGTYVKGVQIGLVNVCMKESENVIPIGLINIVKGGLYELELSASDAIYTNLNFKMGVDRLYTIYKVGYTVFEGESVYSHGIGLGTYIDINEKSKIGLDLTSNHLTKDFLISDGLEMLNKLDLTYRYAINDKFSAFAGPSFNVYISGYNGDENNGILKVPYTLSKTSKPNVDVYNWFGGNVGVSVRF